MTDTSIRKHAIYPDDFPPSWASDYGEDAYGLWLAFKYKGVEQRFRWCEPGAFLMGSPRTETGREREYDEECQRKVTLTSGFWLGEVPVTQALWKVFMGNSPSFFSGDERPVEDVSMNNVQKFIKTLNDLKPTLQLRLPTDAEWEYACRSGTSSVFHFGNKITSEQVNFDGRSCWWDYCEKGGKFRGETIAVRDLPCNDWGLYQMHGNVWEWCHDKFTNKPMTSESTDPAGPRHGPEHILRGGAWDTTADMCRSARRHAMDRNSKSDYGSETNPTGKGTFGFRLALGHLKQSYSLY